MPHLPVTSGPATRVMPRGRISDIYWFNPRNGDVRACGDHGEAVEEDPDAFDIPPSSRDAMAEEHSQDDALDAVMRNEEWERLGLRAGWVRVGYRTDTNLNLECAYVSSASANGAWRAVRHMHRSGTISPAVDVSLIDLDTDFHTTIRLKGHDVVAFVRGGPAKAHDLIDRISERERAQPDFWK